MTKEIYMLQYYFPTQSRTLSEPQCYVTESEADFNRAMQIAKENRYDVVISGKFPIDHDTRTINCKEAVK